MLRLISVSTFIVSLSLAQLAFGQCYIDTEVDCPQGQDVHCANATCEYFSQDPNTLEWILVSSPVPGWLTEIKCGSIQSNDQVPEEIQFSNATNIPSVLGLVGPGFGFDSYVAIGNPVWCIKKGNCSCEQGPGVRNPYFRL
jgi:hypothetical protein